ncbi:MAG: response regulator [Saprospiraceae bacterium]|nr:response regulator [Saprospiraceae bacterium]
MSASSLGMCLALSFCMLGQGQRYIFESVNKMEIVPNIYSIDTDEYGRVWYSTHGRGVFCYDGYENHRYLTNCDDPFSLDNDRIKCLLVDSKKRVWISSIVGLNCLDRNTGKVKRFKSFVDSIGLVKEIYEDKRGDIWFGTDRAFMRFDEINQSLIILAAYQQGTKVARPIETFFEDSQGNLWAGGASGIYRFDKNLQAFELLVLNEKPGVITSLLETKQGNCIVGAHSGLYYFDRQHHKISRIPLPDSLAHRRVNALLEAPNGVLWVGYNGHGLLRWNYSEGGMTVFKNNPFDPGSLAHDVVFSLAHDQFGNLWVGGAYELLRMNLLPQAMKLWSIDTEKPNARVNSIVRIAEDVKGGILVRTVSGLFYFEKLGLPPQEILIEGRKILPWDFCTTSNGTIIAIAGNLFQWEPSSRTFYRVKTPAPPGRINNMEEDANDPLIWWFATPNGVLKYDRRAGSMASFSLAQDPGQINDVANLIDDGMGALWLDLEYNLCRFDKKTGMTRFFNSDSLPPHRLVNNEVLDIILSPQHEVWVTTTGGISIVDPISFNIFNLTRNNDLTDNLASTVLFDNSGHAWIVSPEQILRRDAETKQISVLNTAADFQTATWTRGKCELRDGRLLFAGVRGILSLDPHQTNLARPVASVLLTRFKITVGKLQQEANPEALKLIQLANEQNNFTIEWAGVQTARARELQYECKLEPQGSKTAWEFKGTSREAVFSNVPAGAYTFSVRVVGSDVQPLVLQIAIAPAWWQTSWFKFLLLAIAGTIAYLIWLYKEKQRHLEQQKELAIQNAVYKTRFLANMSHEIRTPMNAILGMSRLLTDKQLPEKEAEYAEAIRQSSENLLVIINDVLDQAKIESGKFSFKQKPFELDVILLHLKYTLGFKANEKGLVFDILINPDTPVQLIGDGVRLNQVLTNLLGNAIKFTNAGEVRLEVAVESIPAYSFSRNNIQFHNPVYLKFQVSDTGIGIPRDQIDHVFESFRQADDQISVLYGGSGLGLSITKEMIEQQGGRIELDSEENNGTIVSFWLPFDQAENQPTPETPESTPASLPEGLKLLLVEDTYFNQMLAIELLKKNLPGVQVDLAENGQIALEKLETDTPYDLVLMDLKMPVMDGLEATRLLKLLPHRMALPVVALTANAVPDELEKCRSAGMNAWVTKPIDIHLLLKTIHQTLNQDLKFNDSNNKV